MSPEDFVYTQIYKGCMAEKVNERIAREHAQMGLDKFKKNKFAKASAMIKEMIMAAKKQSKDIK